VGDDRLIQITPQLRILVAIEAIDGRKGIDSLAQLCREKLNADPFCGCLFYLSQPEREVDPHSDLRRSGILAGHQAFIEGVFPVVAHWPGGIENTARASGTVVTGGRESGNRSGAGVAPGEPVKTPKKSVPGTCVPVTDLPYSATDARAVALSG
jgi:transposase